MSRVTFVPRATPHSRRVVAASNIRAGALVTPNATPAVGAVGSVATREAPATAALGGASPAPAPPPTPRAIVDAVASRQSSVTDNPQAVRMRALIGAQTGELGATITRHVAEAGRRQLAQRAPELSPAVEAIAPELASLAQATAAEALRDPRTLAKLETVVSKIGKAGFRDAVAHAAPDLARAFTGATGLPPVNTEAAAAILTRLPAAAEKLAPAHAASVLAASKGVARKLGLEIAESSAKVVIKGAATTGKAVPALGNAIAIGSACLSAAALVRELARRPPDRERVAKEGVGTLLQTAGIVFPWVALGGDLVDLGWSAKLAAQNKPSASDGQREGLALIGASSSALSAALHEAGHADTARRFGELSAATELATAQPNARSRRALTSAGARAFEALTQLEAQQLGELGGAAPQLLAEGYQQLGKAISRRRRAPTSGVDRSAAHGALGAVSKAILGEAALHHADRAA